MKKFLTALCVLALALICVFTLPTRAEAAKVIESGKCGDNLTWTLDSEGTLTISGTGDMYNYRGVEEVEGDYEDSVDWWDSAPWAGHFEDITRIIIEEGVTSIGNEAFGRVFTDDPGDYYVACENLCDVEIANTVTQIGFYAFAGCVNLQKITLPDNLIEIGFDAFVGCTKLEYNTYGDNPYLGTATNPYYALVDADTSISINKINLHKDTKVIVNGIYYNRFVSVRIDDDGEFYYAGKCGDNLNWIANAEGTLTISGTGKMDRFYDDDVYEFEPSWSYVPCRYNRVIIETGVTDIAEITFRSYCEDNASFYIPSTITAIGEHAFPDEEIDIYITDINAWWNIDFEDSISSRATIHLLDSAGNEITECVVDADTTIIPENAFRGFKNITSVTISGSVTEIGDYAFCGCSNLKSITIPNSVKTIGKYAFDGCSKLKSVTIPGSVTKIGNYAFRSCTRLTSITIPDSVTEIGGNAFSKCSNLKKVTIGKNVKKIGNYAFYKCTSLQEIKIPGKVTYIGNYAFSKCSKLTSITVPNSVTTIGEGAFKDCTALKSAKLGSKVKTIGASAFYNCKRMTSVTLPKSVKSIGNKAFEVCINLTNVYYNGTKTQKTNIDIGSGNSYLFHADWYASRLSKPNADGSVSTSSGKPVIKWKKISGAAKYEVYRATSKTGTYKKIATTAKTSYTDKSAKAGKTYYYKVRAVSADSNVAKSAFSSVEKIAAKCARPAVTVKLNRSKKPYLKWNDVSGAKKYQIYVATSKDGKYKLLATTTKESYTHKTAAKGKTYYYKVRALDAKDVKGSFSAIDRIKVK